MEIEIVVAKYNEDIGWLDQLDCLKTVYDKSDEPSNYIKLPNVGREAHTYAKHVASNYQCLSDFTIFTQGSPFTHSMKFFQELTKPTHKFRAIGCHQMVTYENGDVAHGGLPIKATYEKLTGAIFPGDAIFHTGAIFVAHRSALQKYPCEWCDDLVAELADKTTQGYLAWVMERLWPILLDH